MAELCIDELLRGLIDVHLHTGPDVFLCRIDALEAVKQAELEARMARMPTFSSAIKSITTMLLIYDASPLSNTVYA